MYTIEGQRVKLIQLLDDGRALVAPIYEDPDWEDCDVRGKPVIVKRIFDSPPTAKIAREVAQAKLLLEDLLGQLRQVGGQLRDAQDAYEERMARYAPYVALKKLDNFIAGRITHYVKISEYGTPEILDASKCLSQFGGTRLLSLFGDADGDLAWRLNRFRDENGSYAEVMPCTSYEEAVQKLRVVLYARMKERINPRYVTVAEEHGIPIPSDYVARARVQKREQIETAIQEQRQGLQELEESLAALEET